MNPQASTPIATTRPQGDWAIDALLESGLCAAVLPRDLARVVSEFSSAAAWWESYATLDRSADDSGLLVDGEAAGHSDDAFTDAIVILTKQLVPVPASDRHAAPEGVIARRVGGEPFAAVVPDSDSPSFETVYATANLEWGRSYALTVSFAGHQRNNGGVLLGVGVALADTLADVLGWCTNSWAVLANAETGVVELGDAEDIPDREHQSFPRDNDAAAFGVGDTVTLLVDLSRVATEAEEITASSESCRPPGGRLGLVVNGSFMGVALHCLPKGATLRAGVTLWNLHVQVALDALDDLGRVSCFDDLSELKPYLY